MKKILNNLRIQLHQHPETAFNEIKTQTISIDFFNKNLKNKNKFKEIVWLLKLQIFVLIVERV